MGELSAALPQLGAQGRMAYSLLGTAYRLLDAGGTQEGACQAAAHLARLAMDAVFGWAGRPDGTGRWRSVGQEVVNAKGKYVNSVEAADGDDRRWLDELLARVDELGDFRATEKEKALKGAALLVHRLRGAAAPEDALAPVKRLADLYGQTSDRAHQFSECSAQDVRSLLDNIVGALRGLLLPPDMSDSDLQGLAQTRDPSDADVQQVRGHLATVRDVGVFLDAVPTPAWLIRLGQTMDLGPPGRGEARWVARNAVLRLASAGHRDEVVGWVEDVAGRCDTDEAKLRQVVSVLLDMDPPEVAGALHAAGPLLGDRWTQADICGALAQAVDPAEDLVERAADLLLNSLAAAQGSREIQIADEHRYRDGPMALLRMLSDGATSENAADRIILLAHKLRKARRHWDEAAAKIAEEFGIARASEPPAWWIFPIEYSPASPISSLAELDAGSVTAVDPVTAFSSCLVRIASKAMGWLPADSLLETVSGTPEPLHRRLRVWILAAADGADAEEIVAAVEKGIPSRPPNCDDLALIDRVMALPDQGDEGTAGCVRRWRAALGEPPSLVEASKAIRDDDRLRSASWLYPYCWSALLPQQVVAAWADSEACELLATSIPPRSRVDMAAVAADPPRSGATTWAGPVESPLDAARLAETEPEAAAREIASWRPGPDDWAASAHVLGQTLEAVVSANPAGWGANPVRMVGLLCHPTYISHYLSAFASLAGDRLRETDLSGLISAAAIPIQELWHAEDLGGIGGNPGAYDYNRDWDNSRRAALGLIRQMVVTDTGLAGRDEEVWELLQAEATAPPPRDAAEDDDRVIAAMQNPGGEHAPPHDPRFLAINQRNTQALEVALLLALRNRDTADGIPQTAIDLIEWGLNQPGVEGAKYRSLIAPAVGALTVARPDWVEANKSLLFGDEAGWLGQLTVDEAIRWGQPYQWLSTNSRDSIYDAASRNIPRSLYWVLVAMLTGAEGYEPAAIADRLGDRIPRACRELAELLDYPSTGEGTWDATADKFLGIVLDKHPQAIGPIAFSKTMPHDKWTSLTRKALEKTSGRIDEADWVLRRIFDNPPTVDAAHILVFLVEVQCNPQMTPSDETRDHAVWERMEIAEHAGPWLGAETPNEHDAYKHLRAVLKRHGLLRKPPPVRRATRL